jgi:hypothetical protein
MRRRPFPILTIVALLLGVCAGSEVVARQSTGGVEKATDERPASGTAVGFKQMLRTVRGRYTKHGWNHYGPGYFELDPETGVLTSHGGMGLLWYAVEEYGDFVLELDFRCADATTNSGVFLRVPGLINSSAYIFHSFEVQINPKGEGIHHTGAVYDAEAPLERASNPPGEWNHFTITFVQNHITVELNGKTVIDWEAEPRGKVADFSPRGFIGLQNHDDRSQVDFRNIYVKDLS